MNKTVQDMEKEIESIKSGVNSEKKLFQTGATEANYRNRIQEVEERISGIEEVIEKNGYLSKKKSKKF